MVQGIPAVTAKREVMPGVLYCPLEIDPQGRTVNPCSNHQCWWIGEPPCDAAGRVMTELISHAGAEDKGDGIRTTVAFSRKNVDKTTPYKDFYEKIWTYVQLIWHEAQVIDPNCDPRGERVPAVVEASARVFRYPDMATTRAGIGAATATFPAPSAAQSF